MMTVYVVSYTQYNDDGEIDYCAVDKVFSNEQEAIKYKEKKELETWGADYDVDERVVE